MGWTDIVEMGWSNKVEMGWNDKKKFGDTCIEGLLCKGKYQRKKN